MEWAAMTIAAVVVAAALLATGFWMGRGSSTSALAAAQAVAEMTQVLADEANRQTRLATSIDSMATQVASQTASLSLLAERMDNLSQNQMVMAETMAARGLLRTQTTPAQVGQQKSKPAPLDHALVPPARETGPPSPTERTATG